MAKHYITKVEIGDSFVPFYILSKHKSGSQSRKFIVDLVLDDRARAEKKHKTDLKSNEIVIITKQLTRFDWEMESLLPNRNVLIQ